MNPPGPAELEWLRYTTQKLREIQERRRVTITLPPTKGDIYCGDVHLGKATISLELKAPPPIAYLPLNVKLSDFEEIP